ncbi:hypothetical protein BS78_08G080500 [Paspalum vaginatum]|nr:hypothetical protein BS78_08G080500 [Paspalum vaginatum]KAJ1265498.1 hypothetical protein BS78_08G080500 [Paspalum vaginatum]
MKLQQILIIIASLCSEPDYATCSPKSDRLTLLDFKNSISSDPHAALASWNDSIHFCRWEGVSCDSTKHPRRVTALDLANRGLIGYISPCLGNLTFLTALNLSQNGFAREIHPRLGHLQQLKFLILGNNSLQGRIPNDLANCTRLRAMDLSSNQLVGEIPVEIASLSELASLDLSWNNLTGRIPSSLSNISSLSELITTENQLDGSIPDELGHLRRLTLLALVRNKLSGPIPQSIFNLSSLEIISLESNYLSMMYLPIDLGTTLHNLQNLYLDYNQIGGPIPPSLPNASQLVDIDLSFNSFTGHVPTTLGGLRDLSWLNLEANHIEANDKQSWMFMDALTNCSSLNVLALFQNQLMGELPSSVGNLSSRLQYLLLGRNELSGSVPSSIRNLQGLTSLGLDSNNFDGSVTDWVGNFGFMEKLFLENNRFVGQLPSYIGNLSRLWYIALKSNKFEGLVPVTLGQLQHLQILDISDNKLNGSIPVDLFSIPALISFNLSYNYLQGILPLEVGNAKQLMEIDVSSNKLYGKIPQTLGNCESLENILMGNNFLQGEIPSSLKNLKSLKMLNLSQNNLSGPIPGFLGSLQFLRQLDLSNNNLQGEIPRNGVFANSTALTLDGNKNLCGGLLELHFQSCPVLPSRKRGLSRSLKISILVAFLILALALAATVFLICRKKLRKTASMGPSVLDVHLPQVSYMDLAKATDNFSPFNLIGQGAHGSVYKGFIGLLKSVVAVKVFNLEMQGAQNSFVVECQALRYMRHRNLVRVLTACSSVDSKGNEFKAIVYEFMPSGNLDMLLHSEENNEHSPGHLSLTQRLNIAIDVANALDYLHSSLQPPIVHCDLKPSNILLDNDMDAHVGDFGLARLCNDGATTSTGCSTSSVSLRGTIGYTAPEYATGGHISTAGDVYSFGILLLEMITGKRPTDKMFMEGMDIVDFVQRHFPDQIMQILGVSLKEEDNALHKGTGTGGEETHHCLVSMLETGLVCTRPSPKERPSMQEVARKLHATRIAYLEDSSC